MLTVLRSLAFGLLILSLPQIATSADQVYRCADGTFTNRVERPCPLYESKGIVRVQGGIAEALVVRPDAVRC